MIPARGQLVLTMLALLVHVLLFSAPISAATVTATDADRQHRGTLGIGWTDIGRNAVSAPVQAPPPIQAPPPVSTPRPQRPTPPTGGNRLRNVDNEPDFQLGRCEGDCDNDKVNCCLRLTIEGEDYPSEH